MLAGQMMNLPLSITSIMRFAEKVFPESEIVSVADGGNIHRYQYRDAFSRVRQLANALAEAGLQQGDRIATLAWNDHRHFELYYAISCSGAVCHTINPRLFPEQIKYIINHAEDQLVFVDPMFVPLLESMADELPTVKAFVVLCHQADMPTSKLDNLLCYESFIEGHSSSFDWPELDENAASALCYTSGTTGDPKGVLYSHRSTVLHAYAATMPDAMCLSQTTVALPIVPMFHVNAWGIPYAVPMVGGKLVMPGNKMADGEMLQQLISEESVNVSAGVPTVWLALLNYLRETGKRIDSLERIVVGGAACPRSILQEFREAHGVETQQAWGMTETSPLGVFNSFRPESGMSEEAADDMRLKQGRPIFGVDFRIVDDEEQEQPWDGESAGEVRLAGNWVCDSYFRRETPDSHDEQGYFRTGDLACMDELGFMRITDRTKDVIKSGGEWVSSIDLENAAVSHAGVQEAAVIGIPHPKWTERPLLIVVPVAGESPSVESIQTELQQRVPKWWVPDDIAFVEEIPHTATGKIDKKVLRTQFADYTAKA